MQRIPKQPKAMAQILNLGLVACVIAAMLVWTTRPVHGADRDRLVSEAFASAQWILATTAARAVAQVGARLSAGDTDLGKTIRQRQDLENELNAAWKSANNLTGDKANHDLARASIPKLTSDLKILDEAIRSGFPDYAQLANPTPMDIEEVQRRLDPDEVLLLYLVDRNATYIWAISDTDYRWERAEIGRIQLDAMVAKLRRTLDPTQTTRGFESEAGDAVSVSSNFDLELAYELHDQLIRPLQGVMASKTHVYTVLDGALTSLPFSVLARRPDAGKRDHQNINWMARDFAFTTLTAVSSLRHRALGRENQREISFLGVGDPVLQGAAGHDTVQVASRGTASFFKGDLANVDAIRSLEPLPGTRRELTQISSVLGTDRAEIVLGANATEQQIKALDLSKYSVLAFATHGLVTGELQGLAEPALVLTPPMQPTEQDDGLLTVSEIADLNLTADWVILSACNTAAGDGTPGATGLSGLARAFLYAGARSILVSHWPVRDDAAALLTVGTLEALENNPKIRRSEALRQSMLNLIDSTEQPALQHPSAWAPFVIVGS